MKKSVKKLVVKATKPKANGKLTNAWHVGKETYAEFQKRSKKGSAEFHKPEEVVEVVKKKIAETTPKVEIPSAEREFAARMEMLLGNLAKEVADLKSQASQLQSELADVRTQQVALAVTKIEPKAPEKSSEALEIEIPETIDRDSAVAILAQLRDAKMVKVADIAKFIGIAGSSVTCWLTGVSLPARKHMPKVAEFIGQFVK